MILDAGFFFVSVFLSPSFRCASYDIINDKLRHGIGSHFYEHGTSRQITPPFRCDSNCCARSTKLQCYYYSSDHERMNPRRLPLNGICMCEPLNCTCNVVQICRIQWPIGTLYLYIFFSFYSSALCTWLKLHVTNKENKTRRVSKWPHFDYILARHSAPAANLFGKQIIMAIAKRWGKK